MGKYFSLPTVGGKAVVLDDDPRLSAGGGTGAGLIPTAVKTANYTASAGDLVLADPTAAGFTVTLPASPLVGEMVGVKKIDDGVNAVTVLATGTTIDGDADALLLGPGSAGMFVYDGTEWRISATAVLNAGAPAGGSSLVPTPTYRSGFWYDRRAGMTTQPVGATTAQVPVSTITLIPQYIYSNITIDRLAIINAASNPNAGHQLRLGVYSHNGSTNLPDALMFDSGLITPTTPSTVIAASGTVALPQGWVWFAVSSNNISINNVYGLSTANSMPSPLTGVPDANLLPANVNSNAPMHSPYATATGTASNDPLPATVSATPVYPALAVTLPNFFYRVA